MHFFVQQVEALFRLVCSAQGVRLLWHLFFFVKGEVSSPIQPRLCKGGLCTQKVHQLILEVPAWLESQKVAAP